MSIDYTVSVGNLITISVLIFGIIWAYTTIVKNDGSTSQSISISIDGRKKNLTCTAYSFGTATGSVITTTVLSGKTIVIPAFSINTITFAQ